MSDKHRTLERRQIPLEPEYVNIRTIATDQWATDIEIYVGDVTRIESDLLVVSTFANDFQVRPMTVFQSLWENYGMEFSKADFQELGQGWAYISGPMPGELEGYGEIPFKRILALVLRLKESAKPRKLDFDRMLDAASRILRELCPSEGIETLSLPFLGAGDQGHSHEFVFNKLFDWMEGLSKEVSLKAMKVSAYTYPAVQALNERFQNRYGQVARSDFDELATQALTSSFKEVPTDHPQQEYALKMVQLLNQDSVDFGAVATTARRFVESFCDNIEGKRGLAGGGNLSERIMAISRFSRPPGWYISYLHLLRVVGNHAAHHKTRFKMIESRDVLIVLHAMDRLLHCQERFGS